MKENEKIKCKMKKENEKWKNEKENKKIIKLTDFLF